MRPQRPAWNKPLPLPACAQRQRAGGGRGRWRCDAQWDSTDQIPQRLIDAGTDNGQPFDHPLAGLPASTEFGLQLRHDRTRVGLYDTQARQVAGVTRPSFR